MRNGNGAPVRHAGYSLIEVLIAMAIGGVILAGVVQIFTSSKQTDQLNNGLRNIQENARFALQLLGRDIRMLGYQGCSDPNSSFISTANGNLIANSAPVDNLYRSGLQGFEVTSSNLTTWADNTNWEDIESTVYPDSDVFHIVHAEANGAPLDAPMVSPDSVITLTTNPSNLESGDIALISSCYDAALIRTTTITGGGPFTVTLESGEGETQNTTTTLNTSYPLNTSVYRLESNTYYISNNSNGTPALFRREVDGTVQELVEGIENMQILYGQRISQGTETEIDDLIRYVSADDANLDTSQVVSLRIALLVQSGEEVLIEPGPDTYNLLGAAVAPSENDKQMRRVFTTTIKLRNRRTQL